jgi:metal-responsive CopG/Arc/MetJ family transcriptional regulator
MATPRENPPIKRPNKSLLYTPRMAARPVQISIEPDLLDQIDADPEAREKGRSAFIRSAVQLYLEAKRRQDVERQLALAYAGEADNLLEEVEALLSRQSWPND